MLLKEIQVIFQNKLDSDIKFIVCFPDLISNGSRWILDIVPLLNCRSDFVDICI